MELTLGLINYTRTRIEVSGLEAPVLNTDYLIKREQQELEAALRAPDARVRRRHLEMASSYTSRVEDIKRREQMATGESDGELRQR